MTSKKEIEKIKNMNDEELLNYIHESFDPAYEILHPKPKYKHKFITIKGHRRKDGTWVNSHVKRVRIKDKN